MNRRNFIFSAIGAVVALLTGRKPVPKHDLYLIAFQCRIKDGTLAQREVRNYFVFKDGSLIHVGKTFGKWVTLMTGCGHDMDYFDLHYDSD